MIQDLDEAPAKPGNMVMRYSMEEDRLLGRATDKQGNEFRFILTRRMTHRLLFGLKKLIETSHPSINRTPADMRDEVLSIEHMTAVESGRARPTTGDDLMAGPANAADDHPAPSPYRLLVKIDLTPEEDGFFIRFVDDQQRSQGIRLSRSNIHGLLGVIQNMAKKADWGLPQVAAWTDSASGNPAQGQKKPRLAS